MLTTARFCAHRPACLPLGVCGAEKWNLRVLFLVSTVLGVVSMGSSLLLVGLVLDSPNPGSLFRSWGLPVPVSGGLAPQLGLGWGLPAPVSGESAAWAGRPTVKPVCAAMLWAACCAIRCARVHARAAVLRAANHADVRTHLPHTRSPSPSPPPAAQPYGKLVTMIYLKVSLSDFLTLFSARTEGPFWSMRPGKLLMGAALVALSLSTCLACVWPEGELDGVQVEGLARKGGDDYTLWPLWIWLFCVFW